MDKLIINAAITGMVPQKSDNASVPITVDEIVADAQRCFDSGASIVHVHARHEDGSAAYESEIYAEIISGIRQRCPELLISASTSGRVFHEYSQRAQSLAPEPAIRPDFGSLTLGSMNFPNQASVNTHSMIKALASRMNELGVIPEWECFDMGMIDFGQYLLLQNVLKRPIYCNLFLGSLGAISATPFNLATMVRALPSDAVWSAAGIGRFQFFVNTMAITMGGHVRVGLEDNLFFDDQKQHPASNAGLIDRLVKVAHACGREVATPDEARRIIGLSEMHGLVTHSANQIGATD